MPDSHLRGADAVHDGELEVGFDEPFEHRWRYVEMAARVVLSAIVAAGAAGLLGRGPYSHRTTATADGALAVDREPIARYGTATMVTLHIDTTKFATDHPWTIHINSKFLEPMGLERIEPVPVHMAAEGGGLALTVQLDPDKTDALIRLMLKPTGIGPQTMSAQLGPETLGWTQLVLP